MLISLWMILYQLLRSLSCAEFDESYSMPLMTSSGQMMRMIRSIAGSQCP